MVEKRHDNKKHLIFIEKWFIFRQGEEQFEQWKTRDYDINNSQLTNQSARQICPKKEGVF